MASHPPIVTFAPRHERCEARTVWDGESFTVTCTIGYPEQPAAPATLGDAIDRAFGIDRPSLRVSLGNVDILLTEPSRPTSIELLSNPARWRRDSVWVPVPTPSAFATLLVDYDSNAIAALDLAWTVVFDADRQALSLRLASTGPARIWHAMADTVMIGTNAQQRLSELCFERVESAAGSDTG